MAALFFDKQSILQSRRESYTKPQQRCKVTIGQHGFHSCHAIPLNRIYAILYGVVFSFVLKLTKSILVFLAVRYEIATFNVCS